MSRHQRSSTSERSFEDFSATSTSFVVQLVDDLGTTTDRLTDELQKKLCKTAAQIFSSEMFAAIVGKEFTEKSKDEKRQFLKEFLPDVLSVGNRAARWALTIEENGLMVNPPSIDLLAQIYSAKAIEPRRLSEIRAGLDVSSDSVVETIGWLRRSIIGENCKNPSKLELDIIWAALREKNWHNFLIEGNTPQQRRFIVNCERTLYLRHGIRVRPSIKQISELVHNWIDSFTIFFFFVDRNWRF